jgi:hypothetical protein
MFDVKISKAKYKVQFRHIRTDMGETVTFCTISNGSGVESDGYSCANGNFCKNTNRKEALAQALRRRFPRDLRLPFWTKYFELRHGAW